MATIAAAPPYELAASRYGTMLVNRNDIYMGVAYVLYGECCQQEIEFLLGLLPASGLVIEVGSNMGVHTVPLALELARQGRTMMAFEPQPVIFQQLCANLALNGLTNVTAKQNAVGATAGEVSFAVPNYRATGNFGGTSMASAEVLEAVGVGAGATQRVACVTLDSVVPESESVTLMKIDVEGFELAVLEGAAATIERSRPLLYVENDRAAGSKALIQWLLDHGYRLWWHLPLLFNSANMKGVAQNIYPGVVSINMLCVPVGRECPVGGLQEILEAGIHPILGG
jgi:FkbM family methyltransferase